jgi:hypothetical protein
VWVGDAWTAYQWIQENGAIAIEADYPYTSITYSEAPNWLLTTPSQFPLALYSLLEMLRVVMLLFMF